VLLAERFANGLLTQRQRRQAYAMMRQGRHGSALEQATTAWSASVTRAPALIHTPAESVRFTLAEDKAQQELTVDPNRTASAGVCISEERGRQADLLRCLFGNPFCSVSFESSSDRN
jgi:hypothetical protein